MLDISRLEGIRLDRRPLGQRLVGPILLLNYRLLPGVRIELEHEDRLPPEPVIFAMNHTDRYNYWPFQVQMWRRHGRFTATWVKGKYYENPLVGGFMEKTNQLPTISRGYIITKDFAAAVGRLPSSEEYELLRGWVDAAAKADAVTAPAAAQGLPEPLLRAPRNVLGHPFDPEKEDYAAYVNAVFRIMMRRFVGLNEQAAALGLDLLIFPQGTRSKRLLPGHVGISQIALHLRLPIVPVGCNGCDEAYPGGSPWARKANVVYRIGEPIEYADIPQFQIQEKYEPFSSEAEHRHRARFEGLAALVTDRIEALLDEPYRRATDAGQDAALGTDRFV